MELEKIYSILNSVLPDKVCYAINEYDNETYAEMPYIVYQEISKRPHHFKDDQASFYLCSIQITLVTKKKDRALERKLEDALLKNNLTYSVTSEYHNEDKSLNRVYELLTEVINYGE